MSSVDMTWETPHDFYNALNEEFNFTIDVAAAKETAKCERYYTEADDGLSKDWSGEVCWMNPPYGTQIKFWIKKAYEESLKGATVVALIPFRPDTRYWFDYIWKNTSKYGITYANHPKDGVEVRAIKGRLKFLDNGEEKSSAAFPSAIIIFGEY